MEYNINYVKPDYKLASFIVWALIIVLVIFVWKTIPDFSGNWKKNTQLVRIKHNKLTGEIKIIDNGREYATNIKNIECHADNVIDVDGNILEKI